jgi:hypothetical protein
VGSGGGEGWGLGVGCEPVVEIVEDFFAIPVVPKEMVGFGVGVECFVGGGDFLEPGGDVVGLDEAVAAGGEDEGGGVEAGGVVVGGVDEVGEFEEEAEGVVFDVVGAGAEVVGVGLVAGDGGHGGAVFDEEVLGEAPAWEEACEVVHGVAEGAWDPGAEGDDGDGEDEAVDGGVGVGLGHVGGGEEGAHALAEEEDGEAGVAGGEGVEEVVDVEELGGGIEAEAAAGGNGVAALAAEVDGLDGVGVAAGGDGGEFAARAAEAVDAGDEAEGIGGSGPGVGGPFVAIGRAPGDLGCRGLAGGVMMGGHERNDVVVVCGGVDGGRTGGMVWGDWVGGGEISRTKNGGGVGGGVGRGGFGKIDGGRGFGDEEGGAAGWAGAFCADVGRCGGAGQYHPHGECDGGGERETAREEDGGGGDVVGGGGGGMGKPFGADVSGGGGGGGA